MPDISFELSLDRSLTEFVEQAEFFATNLAEQVLLDILNNSPHWSGRSMSSWTLSLDAPIPFENTSVPKRKGALPQEEAKQISLDTVINIQGMRLGQTIFLQQGTQYLAAIEAGTHGSSAGFVAAAILKYEGLIGLEVSL